MRWPNVTAKASGPLGRAHPLPWERSDPQQHFLPPQPTRRWTLAVQTQGNTVYQYVDITVPSVLRLRSRPSPDPATGVESIRFFTVPDQAVPTTITDGNPAFGNVAILPAPGRWYYAVFANIACKLDLELLDASSESALALFSDPPRASNVTMITDTSVAGADTVILYANERVERRVVWLHNMPNVGAPVVRIGLGAAATATKGLPLAPIAATNVDRMVLEASEMPIVSIHAFGASNFVGGAIFE